MGWLDQFEDWPPYRAIWTRWGGRPWTRIARGVLGRWPGNVLLCCICFALGRGSGLGDAAVAFACAVVFVVVVGHLWV